MTWIKPATGDEPRTAEIVVPRPRDVDVIGIVLSTAFSRSVPIPADWTSALRKLDSIR